MQRHRCFWIEGRGIRMIFGIINNADDGDKDIAKMHNRREDGRKKNKEKRARACIYEKKFVILHEILKMGFLR